LDCHTCNLDGILQISHPTSGDKPRDKPKLTLSRQW
jgi:hypothetical protein